MEHNIDKIIRQKVRDAEHAQRYWQKEVTWYKLSQELRPKYRLKVYYYAAALILLGIVVGTYFYRQADEQNMSNKIQAITPELNEVEQQIKGDEVKHTFGKSTVDYQAASLNKNHNKIIKNIYQKDDSVPTHHDLASSTLNETTTILAESDHLIDIDSLSIKTETEKVEVILGVIPQPEMVTVEKRKKIKIRLFNTNESPFPVATPENTFIIARIK